MTKICSTVKVSPSVLAADFGRLAEDIARAEAAGADTLHLDIMDGHFVPNLSFGVPVVKAIRGLTDLFLDVHLMLDNPADFLQPFAEAGADGLTVHLEVHPEPEEILDQIAALGKQRGLAINPDMPVERLDGRLEKVDLLLLMSVFPGFGGQAFIEDTYARLKKAREYIGDRDIELQVDGGVDTKNAAAIIAAGATNLVAGTSTFRAPEMRAAIQTIRGS